MMDEKMHNIFVLYQDVDVTFNNNNNNNNNKIYLFKFEFLFLNFEIEYKKNRKVNDIEKEYFNVSKGDKKK